MNAQDYLNRGNELFEQNNFDGAIYEYTEALKIDPNFAIAKNYLSNAYFNRGLASYRNGDANKAISDITKAIKYNPNDASFYGARGTIYNGIENWEGVIKDFSEVIRLEPTSTAYFSRAGAYHKKSREYTKKGDIENVLKCLDLAIEDQELAVEHDPTNDDFKKMLELMKSERGKRKSVEEYQKRTFGTTALQERERGRQRERETQREYERETERKYNALREEREQKEREHQEWLASEEGQKWQAEENRKKEEEAERQQIAVKENAERQVKAEKRQRNKKIRNTIIRCIIGLIFGSGIGFLLVGGAYDFIFTFSSMLTGSVIGAVVGVLICFFSGKNSERIGVSIGMGVGIGIISYAIIMAVYVLIVNDGTFTFLVNLLTGAIIGAVGGAIGGVILGLFGGIFRDK